MPTVYLIVACPFCERYCLQWCPLALLEPHIWFGVKLTCFLATWWCDLCSIVLGPFHESGLPESYGQILHISYSYSVFVQEWNTDNSTQSIRSLLRVLIRWTCTQIIQVLAIFVAKAWATDLMYDLPSSSSISSHWVIRPPTNLWSSTPFRTPISNCLLNFWAQYDLG